MFKEGKVDIQGCEGREAGVLLPVRKVMEVRESLMSEKDELVAWCTREWHQDVAVLIWVVEVAFQPQISVSQDAPFFVQDLKHVAVRENILVS